MQEVNWMTHLQWQRSISSSTTGTAQTSQQVLDESTDTKFNTSKSLSSEYITKHTYK